MLPVINFNSALNMAENSDLALFFYEGGGSPLTETPFKGSKNISIFIGPEGGFDTSEVNAATEKGFVTATLGPRILRAVTAPLAAVGAVMLLTGNMD